MNSTSIVVDASTAVKWVIDEEHTDRARQLLIDNARVPILAPPHLATEVTNAIYQRLRRRDVTADEAEEALDRFLAIGVELITPPGLYQRAFNFARTHGLKDAYDSLYVVLAQMAEVDLWTDDRVLLKAVASLASWVRWIGDYPSINRARS
ncbi:MAG: type II toxin-antitoxin system VapC family toxin [Chloroflexi bacterium]|nr:type II toxin-antitoxin system VapC family toxin [Chloroflexota bacterium]